MIAFRPATTTLVVALALAASACASSDRSWAKAGGTESDFNRDSYSCAQETNRDTFRWRAPIAGGPRYGPEVDKDMYRACMKAKGYQLVEGGQWQGFRD